MSEPVSAPGTEASAKQDPEALVLRGRPRPVVRFRRGLIIGLAGAVAISLVTLSWFALDPPSFRGAATETAGDDPTSERGPDGLSDLPKSYGEVPRLGPPLPGDLGRPILERQRELGELPAAPVDAAASEAQRAEAAAQAERERLAQARQAAQSAPVIVQLGGDRVLPARAEVPFDAPSGAVSTAAPVPASQQRKLDFARAGDGEVNPHVLRPPPSPWTLSAGTVIPASLITGLNSDLPGLVIAQVTENVRDTATGRTTLVPQGARLVGSYDSVVAYGQRRALLVWNRIVFPDGASVELDHLPATDVSGYTGVRDGIDSHTWQLLKGIGLSTLLGVGTQLSLGSSESDLVRAVRESAQQNAANAGNQLTIRSLDVQPTITVRPGWPVRAVVNKDLVLQRWRG